MFPSRTFSAPRRPFLTLALLMLAATAAAGETPQRVYTVAFAQDTLANDWRAAQVRLLEAAFAPHGHVRFIHTDARGSTARQVQDIEDLILRGVDVLMTSPRDSAVLTPVVRRAYRQGIPVVLLTRRIQGDDYTSFVGPDDELIALSAAHDLAEELGGKGRIVMLRGLPTATTTQARERGFMAGIERHPGLEVVRRMNANYLRGDAIRAMAGLLEEGVAFDAIYAHSDSMAAGARIALRRAGIDPATIPTVAIDYIREARQAIRDGEQLASYVYPTCAAEAAQVVLAILRGEAVPREVIVPSLRVTRDNVDTVEPIF